MLDEIYLTTKVVIQENSLVILVTSGTDVIVKKSYRLGRGHKTPGWLKDEILKALDHALDLKITEFFVG